MRLLEYAGLSMLASVQRTRIFLTLCTCLACSEQSSSPRPHKSPKPAEAPLAAYEADGPRVYVSNEDSGDVSILDASRERELGRIHVGKRPRGLRLSRDQNTLYVAVSGSAKAPPGVDEASLPPPDRQADGIAVVDLVSQRVVRTLESGADPEAFDLSPDETQIYVSNEDTSQASILDVASGKVLGAVAVGGEPEGVTTRPDGAVVYVTSEQDHRIDVVDPFARGVVAQIPTGMRPRAVVFTPDGTRAFVTSELGAVVGVIDAKLHRPAGEIKIEPVNALIARPMGLALSPDAKTLFVSTGRGRTVAVVDVASARVLRTVSDVGARPWGLAVSSDGKKLYTANGPSNDVSVIDLASWKVITKIAVGTSPWGLVTASRAARPVAGAPKPEDDPGLRDLLARQQDERQWVMPGKSYGLTRFSTLTDVRADNAGRLQLAWSFDTGFSHGHEAAPLVVNDTMYVVTPFPNHLIALDLTKPGAPVKWRYEPKPAPAAQGVACCDTVNRGAAYADGKIFYNTLDAHTVAVDAQSGAELWKAKLGDINKGETMTMAPLVVRDKVLVGNSGGEYGVRGWLAALDTASGRVAWRAYSTGPDHDVLIGPGFRPFYALDRGRDLGVTTWPPDKWQIGGGTVWGWVSYDPELDLIFYGTSNPGPWNPDLRPGDNKWTCGVFARKPATGEAVWFYQWSPHDLYDHDGVNENLVLDLPIEGVTRKVLVHPGRTGYVYVVDRTSGQVLSATPFVHITTARGVDLQSGRLIPVLEKQTGSGKSVRDICPAAPGGKDWQPSAYSPQTGLLYIPANNLCEDQQNFEANYIAGTPYLGTETRMYAGPGGHRGEFIGWDVVGKKAAFRLKEPFPVWSGVLVTAGDVAFYGTMDGWFKAVHARSGQELWKFKTASGVVGQPITFRGPDGAQYVSVLAGVGGWAGAVVSGELDVRDRSAALGFAGAMADLKQHTKRGGTLYTFRLPAGL